MGVLRDAAIAFKDSKVLGLDTETTGLNCRVDELKIVSISDGHRTFIFEEKHWQDRENFTRFLVKVVYPKVVVAHNWCFDSQFLMHNFPDAGLPRTMFDTMIAEQLITAGLRGASGDFLSCGLEGTAWRHLHVKMDKTYQKWFIGKFGPLELPDEAREYIENDTKYLIRIARSQKRKIQQHQLEEVWELEQEVLPVFCKLTYRGVKIDKAKFIRLFDCDDHDDLGFMQQRMKVEEELVLFLTKYYHFDQLRKKDEMQEELDAYLALEQRAIDESRALWRSGVLDCPGSWSDAKYDDLTPHKNPKFAGWTMGEKRFVDKRMQFWRKDHERPKAPKADEGPINLGSPTQLLAALNHLGLDLEKTGKLVLKGKLARTKDETQQKVIRMLLEWRRYQKLEDAFFKPLLKFLDENDVLHGNFKPYGTRTGRPSCAAPNLLQMPKRKEFRDCFVAREGNVIVRLDYAQMELRIVADRSGDRAMLKAFREGLDLHTYTASLMYGVGYAEVTDGQRKVAKVFNFGILYGMGAESLYATMVAEGIQITLEEVQERLEGWHTAYPEASQYIYRSGREALKIGYTKTIMGRKQWFELPRNAPKWMKGKARRVGANHCIQGSNADTTKWAMVYAQPKLEALGGGIILQVYDELVAEVPEEHGEKAAAILSEAMLKAGESLFHVVPIAVDGEVSRSWSGKDPLLKLEMSTAA